MPSRSMPLRSMAPRLRVLSAYAGVLIAALLCLCAPTAWAQSRAWVDRDRIAYEETTVLHLEINVNATQSIPDLSTIAQDFRIVDQNVQHKVMLQNGSMMLHINMRLTLQPTRAGELEIPAMQIGNERTRPLRVWVAPPVAPQAPVAPPTAARTDAIFIETRVDSVTPYVQQTVGYTVRLFYESGLLIDGRLDHDPPEGATLQKIGDDQQLMQTVGGNAYNVLERRFLLIPERSGTVTVPAARFLGRGIGMFDSVFGDARKELRVRGDPVVLQVKPIPAAAPQPWLPLRGLRLRYLEAPKSLRVGESAAVTIEAVADGTIASQLPELTLGIGTGAQLFPEPAQPDDRFVDDRPQATVVRRVMVVAVREGALRIAGPRIAWWDTEAGVARIAALPDIAVQVSPGAATATAADIAAADAAAAGEAPPWHAWRPQNRWAWALLVLPVFWIIVMGFGWQLWTTRRRQLAAANAATAGKASSNPAPARQAPTTSGSPLSAALRAVPPADAKAWANALARGNVAEIARLLCAMASPAAADLDAVHLRLADPAQRAAVDALQRARWGDGDAAAAVAAMRAAFATGPRWRSATAPTAPALLPPLYPEA